MDHPSHQSHTYTIFNLAPSLWPPICWNKAKGNLDKFSKIPLKCPILKHQVKLTVGPPQFGCCSQEKHQDHFRDAKGDLNCADANLAQKRHQNQGRFIHPFLLATKYGKLPVSTFVFVLVGCPLHVMLT